jgi:hypothetical protein
MVSTAVFPDINAMWTITAGVKVTRIWYVLSLLSALTAASCGAQEIRRSQLASVSQMVGPTRIEIIYRRPVARGRDLFGTLVPYGRVWSPSADTAAIFSTTTALDINGSRLPAGRYSMWMLPARDAWTVIFSSAQPVFHLRYSADHDVLRLRVTPHAGDHMETLAFIFPMVDADSAELDLHWGKTVVPVKIHAR